MKTVLIKEDIVSRNNERAKEVRALTREKNVYYVNVMSSPGAGKTTLLKKLIPLLGDRYRIGVIEADIDSDKDALDIERATGVKTIQMHTGGACHITCQMSMEALQALGTDGLDLIFLEKPVAKSLVAKVGRQTAEISLDVRGCFGRGRYENGRCADLRFQPRCRCGKRAPPQRRSAGIFPLRKKGRGDRRTCGLSAGADR